MGNNVLVVDDDAGITSSLRELLSEEGYDVFIASSGIEALGILENNSIPVIITDIQMPQMGGIELCHKIREYDQISVVIAMTGNSKFFEFANCREEGFDDYLKKPFDPAKFIGLVDYSMDKVKRWKELF
ncbi:MAG: response regulator [Lentisphaeraceae bacterium]|nr:response regulator [Lentisphaeraceae bacterium]